MAFEVEYLEDFTREVVPKMVEAGLAILKPEVERSLENAIGENVKDDRKRTGQLLKSVDASHTFIRDGGVRFKGNVYFRGNRTDGRRNGEIAAYKEYGTPRTANRDQAPSHFVKKAVRKTRSKINKRMQEVLENELKI